MTAILAQPPHATIEGWRLRPLERSEAALAYPLLLALESPPVPLPAWQERVRGWLAGRRSRKSDRGIMTLRNQAGVIAGMFFYVLATNAEAPPVLLVPFIRAIEPVGGWRGLGAVLQAIDALAQRLGCSGILVQAEPDDNGTWIQISSGLEAIGRSHGYVRRGTDWYRPIENEAGIVRLPGRLTQ
ncbi:hypothetical protein [Benzoatithermus flavus]|uniref:N-acetyltransferase domain-containing protein n=1 Tax=Benzoatithermus flavus TaxID=3108223 RepID=A0ABU8XY71_9PROT